MNFVECNSMFCTVCSSSWSLFTFPDSFNITNEEIVAQRLSNLSNVIQRQTTIKLWFCMAQSLPSFNFMIPFRTAMTYKNFCMIIFVLKAKMLWSSLCYHQTSTYILIFKFILVLPLCFQKWWEYLCTFYMTKNYSGTKFGNKKSKYMKKILFCIRTRSGVQYIWQRWSILRLLIYGISWSSSG